MWKEICAIEDIPVLGARRVQRDHGLDVAVFRTATDQVFALLDHCPHKGGPLSQGIVFGEKVACPLHYWTNDLCDGQALEPDHGCTASFAVKVSAGKVHLLSEELADLAVDVVRLAAGPQHRPRQPS